jgi:hypothetical protein
MLNFVLRWLLYILNSGILIWPVTEAETVTAVNVWPYCWSCQIQSPLTLYQGPWWVISEKVCQALADNLQKGRNSGYISKIIHQQIQTNFTHKLPIYMCNITVEFTNHKLTSKLLEVCPWIMWKRVKSHSNQIYTEAVYEQEVFT